MKRSILFCLVLMMLILTGSLFANRVAVIEIEGMITHGQLSYLEREIGKALSQNVELVVIQLNTPGGLVDVTFKINELILNTPIPIVVYVAPSGAIAASAGAFIVLASDIAAMAPATTIGAAQPISITPEGTSDAGEKTRNFLARQAKSLAEDKDRPTDIALGFVENNVSLTSTEALDKGVIDYVAESLEDLLDLINGEEITKKSVTYTIDTDNYTLYYSSMTHTEAMQQFISNPQIAMLFMMLGVMGLYFGFSSPGTFVPEVLGAICLIIGIYGIGLFGTNTAGIVLLFAGVLLITAEIFTSGFGVLGIGGIISMVIGALMLPVEPLMGEDWYGTFIRSVLGFGIGIAIILIFVVQRVINTRRHLPLDKINLSLPDTGIVIKELNPQGMVRAKGELWKATSADESHIPVGTEVNVIRKDSLTLWVEPLNKAKEE